MRINHNISAQMANVNLKKSDRRMSASLERLSSGYKINKAADDAAGMAVSNKMRTQIRALDQASRNASDGESVIQIAEGAMGEIESILQRVRELGVQAANDVYCLEDRDAIQSEVDELLDEVDRIASVTEFNGTPLLDGSAARTIFSSNAKVNAMTVSMNVTSGEYEASITAIGTSAQATFGYTIPAAGQPPYEVHINGNTLSITSDDTDTSVQEKVIEMCDLMNIDVEAQGGSFLLTTRTTGSIQQIAIREPGDTEDTISRGTDAEIALQDGFSDTATYKADGNHVTIVDNAGFQMEVSFQKDAAGSFKLDVYDAGYMTIQIGANEHQTLDMNFTEVTCVNLALRDTEGVNTINYCTAYGATTALDKLDDAIQKVSNARSTLGAYQNRLDSTISSLDISNENVTDAMSRIYDTDIAEEMTIYTQQDVLSQVATAMLSQANNRPQQVMNLLQG